MSPDFSELGVLCDSARVTVFRFRNSKFNYCRYVELTFESRQNVSHPGIQRQPKSHDQCTNII